jgi:two-component system cell cycle response regulator DivK
MKLFHDLLEAQGYETLQTREGLEALTLARLHRPDLILMDIQLPEISGLEVTKWLKEDDELSHIPVDRRDRLRHEGRRGADPRRRLRGLHRQADLGRPFLDTIRRFWSSGAMTGAVLVVDDIEANVRLLEAKLTGRILQIVTAPTAQAPLAHGPERAPRRHAAGRDDARHGRVRGLPAAEGRPDRPVTFRWCWSPRWTAGPTGSPASKPAPTSS